MMRAAPVQVAGWFALPASGDGGRSRHSRVRGSNAAPLARYPASGPVEPPHTTISPPSHVTAHSRIPRRGAGAGGIGVQENVAGSNDAPFASPDAEPSETSKSRPVHTAGPMQPLTGAFGRARQVEETGSYEAPSAKPPALLQPPQMITSRPVQTAEAPARGFSGAGGSCLQLSVDGS